MVKSGALSLKTLDDEDDNLFWQNPRDQFQMVREIKIIAGYYT